MSHTPSSPLAKKPVESREKPADSNEVLKQSAKPLATVFDTVQAGILIIDAEHHHVVDANPKALELIGAPREKVVGLPCHQFICPAEKGCCPITDLSQTIDKSERELLTADGRVLPVLKSVASIKVEGRGYLVETFIDISDYKRAERKRRESEERFEDLFENANDLIQSVAPDGTILYVNRSWRTTLGYSQEDLEGMSIMDVIHPDCREHCALSFQLLMGGENIPRIETTFLAKDGRSVVLEGSINTNFFGTTPVSTRGIFRDITARKAAEAALIASEERYRDLFSSVSDLIQMVTPEGTFVYANPAWCSALGYTEGEINTLSFRDIVPEDYRSQFMAAFDRLRTGKSVKLLETVFLTRDGHHLPVEGTFSHQVEGNEITGIRCIWRDITERKRAARKVQEWNRLLEVKIDERTRQLRETQAKLIQSEKMATLAQLVSGAAHELNNPIGGILNAVEVLLASCPLGETSEEHLWLQAIEKAATRCRKIVSNLKEFSPEVPCSFVTVNLNSVLEAATAELSTHLPQGVSLHLQETAGDLAVEADPQQVTQLCTHLLLNAVSAVEEQGAINLEIEACENNQQVRLVIRDNGCGISADHLPKVFDPFFTTRPVGQGTGLGLTACYGIVKRHHGEIEISSHPGEGTTVTVVLPRVQPNETAQASHTCRPA